MIRLAAAAAHAALVLERATDAVAWMRSGASRSSAVEAACHNFPELTIADRLEISRAVHEAIAADKAVA
jgi:hypothetical protein